MVKKLLSNVLVIIISVIVFLTIIETAQRVRYFFKYHSSYWLGYGFAPRPENYNLMLENTTLGKNKDIQNIEANIINNDGYYKYNPKSPNMKEHINSSGFRGNEIGAKDKYRIVALGGSTTFCVNVGDEFTYPEYLSRKTGYEVINAGLCEADTDVILNLFEKEIVALKPDMVIVSSVANNFMSSQNTYIYSRLQKLNHFLLSKSLFYMTLREKIKVMAKKPIVDIYRGAFDDVLDSFLKDKVFYASLKEKYRSIIRIAQKNNITVIIIKEPVWLQANHGMLMDEKFRPVWDKTYNILDEIGREYDVKVLEIDLPENDDYFIDGIHLTPKGNEYLADTIYRKVFNK